VRILIRSRRDPFTATAALDTYSRNTIGDNVGNLVFSNASHRLLSRQDNEVVSNQFKTDPGKAAQINEEYDAFVIPLANAFRPSFRQYLDPLSDLVERLTIPVVVLGVGAQAGTHRNLERLDPIEQSVKRFVGAVLDRSPAIGVRGEVTAEYLQKLGFSDVEIIGCPSLFMRGPDLRVEKSVPRLTRRSPVAINISPYVAEMGPISMAAYGRYPKLTYVAQDRNTLRLLLEGDVDPKDVGQQSLLPVHQTHPLYREDKIRFFLDPWTWLEFLGTQHFSYGSRIHGNITALLAGTPAVVLAHDSRTLELAQYHEIPHRLVTEVAPDVDPAQLYAEADFSGFNDGHLKRWETFAQFMERSGLTHIYQGGTVDPGAAAFDARVAATTFPGPVRPLRPSKPRLVGRARRLVRRAARVAISRLPRR
jgi:polysaccharide pyruvyl transferase